MLNIQYALYELEASHSLNATSHSFTRQGALLKIHFSPEKVGYADCHPWPELGDLPLKEQLSHLAQGQLTCLTHCALNFARLDADARCAGQSILSQVLIPRSHFLVTHLLNWTPQQHQTVVDRGYTHVKLKVGRDVDREIDSLHALFANSPLKLRLDFNETLTPITFRYFLQKIQTLYDRIDLIEDPFPFNTQEWSAIQKEGWTLACDRQAHLAYHYPEAAHILIIKPALQPDQQWQKWKDRICIVTSYLGHPFEQVTAAYVASQLDPFSHLTHGLLSHHAYSINPFSRYLNWKNPQFIPPPGKGFGFDQEFQKLEWRPLDQGVPPLKFRSFLLEKKITKL